MAGRLNIDVGGSVSEIRAVLKYIDIKTHLFKIMFRGKGIEFDGFDSYTPSDDASLIDWKASTRSNKTLIKKYKEERELKFLIVVDVGDNMVFGSGEKLKCEYAAEFVLAFSDLILQSGDKVGLLLYDGGMKEFIPPKRGKSHFAHLIDVLSDGNNYGGVPDINRALDFVLNALPNKMDVIILISDFINFGKSSKYPLQLIGGSNETLAFMIRDKLDSELPNLSGEFVIEGPQGQRMVLNPKISRRQYKEYSNWQRNMALEIFKDSGIDALELDISKSFAVPLVEFLKSRTGDGR